ncbi:hypothetical protein RH831_08925 [Halodesulfurarchaeum sp. HSR-GB]|uniref:hypothetical protein n=1 Tax=Halodesulfurarchaeum sp. HSR-GB TaxID=3074077 RepID=UPI002855E066|nr:hypothetical protein [Halodesulfurarchaeum sp. HSR-GB]MDR5657302.1 hypothetical protein [Halodesulfurarchaeum sp. HSR-GB]
MDRRSIIVISLTVLVMLSGCSTLGLGGPTITESETGVTSDGIPYLEFEYTTDDYATALLENPENQIVDKRELSPEENRSALAIGEPQSGSYTLVLQQGGETQVEKNLDYDGPSPQIESVDPKWTGSTLKEISITVSNSGDLPTRVSAASYSSVGETVEDDSMYEWVEANSSNTITLTSGYQEAVRVEEPGDATVSVQLETTNKTLSTSFTKSFEGPNLEIESVNPNWEGGDLDSAEVLVENIGDMSTIANASIEHNGETLAYSGNSSIGAGESALMEITSLGNIYYAENAGDVNLDLIVDGESQHLSRTISHKVQDANVSISSFLTSWGNGELNSATAEVTNNGEVDGDVRVSILVDGTEVSGYDTVVKAGDSRSFDFDSYDTLYSATSGGTYDVTFEVSGVDGDDSKTRSKTFDGLDTSISSIDSSFTGNYDSETSDLLSLNFNVRNRGDVVLVYDAIEVEIGSDSTQESLSFASEVAPGGSKTEYFHGDLTVDNGEYTMTVTLLNDGEEVGSAQTSVSVSG